MSARKNDSSEEIVQSTVPSFWNLETDLVLDAIDEFFSKRANGFAGQFQHRMDGGNAW